MAASAGGEQIAGCATDVLVSFPESLHVYTGLLTVATVCGGLSGILAAVLLYVFCLKPLLLTRQVSKCNTRARLDNCVCVSSV